LSLPVWISFMETALKGVPVMEPVAPEGLTRVAGEWYFEEFTKGAGIATLKADDKAEATEAPAVSDEKKKIVDLFKN
jgi:penicillin-binding protein 1A